MLTMEQLGLPQMFKSLIAAAPRAVPGHRPDRLGQDARRWPAWSTTSTRTVDHHIITIEDPIEFYHYHKKSTVNQREVGVDVPIVLRSDCAAPCGRTRT